MQLTVLNTGDMNVNKIDKVDLFIQLCSSRETIYKLNDYLITVVLSVLCFKGAYLIIRDD